MSHLWNFQEYYSHIIFVLKPNFALISIKVLILVLYQHKGEEKLLNIKTTAKLIITGNHHHLTEGIFEVGTSQELSGLLQPSFVNHKPNLA